MKHQVRIKAYHRETLIVDAVLKKGTKGMAYLKALKRHYKEGLVISLTNALTEKNVIH